MSFVFWRCCIFSVGFRIGISYSEQLSHVFAITAVALKESSSEEVAVLVDLCHEVISVLGVTDKRLQASAR